MVNNSLFRLVIYPSGDGHAIGFIVPATESSPARIRGLLKFENLSALDDHADKIKEYIKYLREGGIPSEILKGFEREEEG